MSLHRERPSGGRRIAMVAACPFPSPRGSQVLIRELAQALAARGHTVHVVTYPFAQRLVPIHGIFIHRASVPGLGSRGGRLGWRKILLDLALALTLYRVVRRERIEVIHAHNYEGPLVGFLVRRLTGVPVVYHSHNALSDELGYYFPRGVRRAAAFCAGWMLDRLIPRRADFSIALTPELEQFLRRCGVRRGRLAVVAPGAPVLTAPNRGEQDGFGGRFVVMYTGNLDPYQDLEVLFEGFTAFSQSVEAALLVIVTHDTEWSRDVDPRLQRLLDAGRARIIVVSTFSRVRQLMERAHVLICPRRSWSGFPIKLINYMTAGKAVMAAAGSAKTVTHEQNGLTFSNGDARAVAAGLRRLFDDPALRQRLGECARASAARLCSWKQAVSQLEQIYSQVAGPGETPSVTGVRAGRILGIDRLRQRSYKRHYRRFAV